MVVGQLDNLMVLAFAFSGPGIFIIEYDPLFLLRFLLYSTLIIFEYQV